MAAPPVLSGLAAAVLPALFLSFQLLTVPLSPHDSKQQP